MQRIGGESQDTVFLHSLHLAAACIEMSDEVLELVPGGQQHEEVGVVQLRTPVIRPLLAPFTPTKSFRYIATNFFKGGTPDSARCGRGQPGARGSEP